MNAIELWFKTSDGKQMTMIARDDDQALSWIEIWESRGVKLMKTLDVDMSRFKNGLNSYANRIECYEIPPM